MRRRAGELRAPAAERAGEVERRRLPEAPAADARAACAAARCWQRVVAVLARGLRGPPRPGSRCVVCGRELPVLALSFVLQTTATIDPLLFRPRSAQRNGHTRCSSLARAQPVSLQPCRPAAHRRAWLRVESRLRCGGRQYGDRGPRHARSSPRRQPTEQRTVVSFCLLKQRAGSSLSHLKARAAGCLRVRRPPPSLSPSSFQPLAAAAARRHGAGAGDQPDSDGVGGLD
jgi:hypothetical protein